MTKDVGKTTELAGAIAIMAKNEILKGMTPPDAFDAIHNALAWIIAQNINEEGRANMTLRVVMATPMLVQQHREALGAPKAGDTMVTRDGSVHVLADGDAGGPTRAN